MGALLLVVTSGAGAAVARALRLSSLGEAGGRSDVYPQLLTTALERPLLGNGYGSSEMVVDSVQASLGVTSGYAGNVFIDLVVAAGLVGIAAFGITFIACSRRAAIALRSARRDRVIAVSWLAIAAGGFTNAQGEALLLAPGTVGAPAFWFAVAMLSALGLRRRASGTKSQRSGVALVDGEAPAAARTLVRN